MKIITLDQIKQVLNSEDIISEIEKGFVEYSKGNTIVPPVGELLFENPPGDVHIKYGYLKNDDYYVVKVASSFYENPKLNLPSSNGMIILFSQKTGEILGMMLDEGYLTDIRTAAAGAIVAKYLAPKKVTRIGIVGTGTQAKLQLSYLRKVISCDEVMVWGRNNNNLISFKESIENEFKKDFAKPFSIQLTHNMNALTASCNLIVTTTPARSPLIWANQIQPGTHITAVGADSPHKQELDPNLFKKADIIVADSIIQCSEMGEINHAIKNNIISKGSIKELGEIIVEPKYQRKSDHQITIADLTGIAVQDIQIAKLIYQVDL